MKEHITWPDDRYELTETARIAEAKTHMVAVLQGLNDEQRKRTFWLLFHQEQIQKRERRSIFVD